MREGCVVPPPGCCIGNGMRDVVASSRLDITGYTTTFRLEVVTAFILQALKETILLKVLFGRAWEPVAVMHLK